MLNAARRCPCRPSGCFLVIISMGSDCQNRAVSMNFPARGCRLYYNQKRGKTGCSRAKPENSDLSFTAENTGNARPESNTWTGLGNRRSIQLSYGSMGEILPTLKRLNLVVLDLNVRPLKEMHFRIGFGPGSDRTWQSISQSDENGKPEVLCRGQGVYRNILRCLIPPTAFVLSD